MTEKRMTDEQLMGGIRRAFSRYSAPPARPLVRRASPLDFSRLNRLRVAAIPLAVGLAIVLLAQTLTQPSSAFATWTEAPGEVDSATLSAASDACASTLPLVALDQRGRVAVALFSDGRYLADCMLVDGEASASSHGAEVSANPSAPAIQVFNHGRYERESTVHIISGGVSAEVKSVIVTRDDGVEVTATVADGVFLVWWPVDNDASTFRAFDADGDVVETIDNPMRLPRS